MCVYLIHPVVVGVENGDEADGDAGDGHQVEHGVEQLVPDPAAAAARPVEQHR
jgi:hypothetical protein